MAATDTMTDRDRHTHIDAVHLDDGTTVSATESDGQGAWLSPRDAQVLLGISERTLWRRLARGQYEKRPREGGLVEIWVPTARPSMTEPAPVSDRQTQEESFERGLVLVDRFGQALAQQVAPLLQELAATREQLVDLAQENGRLSAENSALAARVAELEQRPATPVMVTVNDRLETPAKPWWRRLLLWAG